MSSRPNILITGTPGTGKTSLSEAVAQRTGLKHVNVGDLVRSKELHDGHDAEFDTFLLNEDKICDELEDVMSSGVGVVLDFHTADIFPERWFHLVVVLRANNEVLYPRLEARGYSVKKIQENVEAEIMQVVRDEVAESYDPLICVELLSNTVDEMNSNLDRIVQWVNTYEQQQQQQ